MNQRMAPGLVVAHDLDGIDSEIADVCDRFAALGYVVVCPDLFQGTATRAVADLASMRTLGRLAAFDLDRGTAELLATVDAMSRQRSVNGRVGLVGFGLGGLLTWLAASQMPIDVAVAYEPAGMEHHLDHALSLPTPLLLHLAADDDFMPLPVQQEIVAALDPVPPVEIEIHPHCRQARAAAAAFVSTAEFLRAHLQA